MKRRSYLTLDFIRSLKDTGYTGSYLDLTEDQVSEFKKGGIHIKKSKQGSLRSALHIPQGEKIPAKQLAIHPGDSPTMRKKKQFAINAREWKHAEGGLVGNVPQRVSPDIDRFMKIYANSPRFRELAFRIRNSQESNPLN